MLDVLRLALRPESPQAPLLQNDRQSDHEPTLLLSPAGNSYGSAMTPANIGPGRLDHRTSLGGFHFCNASSGFAGFTGTIWTGCRLYEHLSGDSVHRNPDSTVIRERIARPPSLTATRSAETTAPS